VATPVSCAEVKNCVPESKIKTEPVGETTMLPVMADVGTVKIPVLARIA
jgi:hypothetical protein